MKNCVASGIRTAYMQFTLLTLQMEVLAHRLICRPL